ncbi:MAG: serpin family protein, partial [Bacteroidota bacterium]
MKKLLFILVLIVPFYACQNDNIGNGNNSKNTEKAKADLRKVDKQFVNNSNAFSFNLSQKLDSHTFLSENYMVSPLSIHLALGMLLNGANENTATEIKDVLGFESSNMEEINENYRNLIYSLPELDNVVDLGIANSVWHDENYIVKDDFLQTLNTSFDAEITGYDFRRADAPQVINNWVANKTNNLIEKMIEEIKPEEVMFLINALYFKGDWTV